MDVWQPMINLRDSVYSNPPKATFFLCLLILALSFICLSSYSYTHTLPNPDKTKVWTPLRTLYFYTFLKGSNFFSVKNIWIIRLIFVGLESSSLILIAVPVVYERDQEFFWACCNDLLSFDKWIQCKQFYSHSCHHSASQGASGYDYQLKQQLTWRPWIANYAESWATISWWLVSFGLFFCV